MLASDLVELLKEEIERYGDNPIRISWEGTGELLSCGDCSVDTVSIDRGAGSQWYIELKAEP